MRTEREREREERNLLLIYEEICTYDTGDDAAGAKEAGREDFFVDVA